MIQTIRRRNFSDHSTYSHFHDWLLHIMSDIYDLPNGIILWITSKEIRRTVRSPCLPAAASTRNLVGTTTPTGKGSVNHTPQTI